MTTIRPNRLANRSRAICQLHRITDVVHNLANPALQVAWFGSYDNPEVQSYPVVKVDVNLQLGNEWVTVAEWSVDCGGNSEPHPYTDQEILETVVQGVKQLETWH